MTIDTNHFKELLDSEARNLDEKKQNELKQLNNKLTELSQAFESNLASTVGYIDIKPEQLDGLTQDYKDAHPAKDGLIRITTNTPDYVPFMKYATDRTAARELFIQSKNRAKEQNLPLLDQVLKCREQKAHLLGFKNLGKTYSPPKRVRYR
jgi:thimet oligopeptidase